MASKVARCCSLAGENHGPPPVGPKSPAQRMLGRQPRGFAAAGQPLFAKISFCFNSLLETAFCSATCVGAGEIRGLDCTSDFEPDGWRKMAQFRFAGVALAALSGSIAHAAVTMPAIFSDGLILQCNTAYDQRPFFYGYANAGEMVQVNRTTSTGTGLNAYTATADETGFWIATLNADCSTGNYTFSVAGSADNYAAVTKVFDVTYGDVFLCSGQSNMVFSVKSAFNFTEGESLGG